MAGAKKWPIQVYGRLFETDFFLANIPIFFFIPFRSILAHQTVKTESDSTFVGADEKHEKQTIKKREISINTLVLILARYPRHVMSAIHAIIMD